jgi:DNA-binding ferritin-like protein
MNIEIIKTSNLDSSLDSVRIFGIILNKTNSIIRMLHWFVTDYNAHEVLGELYSDLNDLFDSLQEEIIGTSKKYNVLFPKFNITLNQLENIDQYNNNENIINVYYNLSDNIKTLLTSLEFNDYSTKVKSGINNTKEEILSRLNKTEYLLSMLELK